MSRSFAADDVRIRAATVSDAAAIAQVHVQAWHETYRGLVSDELLAALSVERNTHMWTNIIASAGAAVLVAERASATDAFARGGEDEVEPSMVVGFGSASSARDPTLGTEGEVTAIYLLDRAKHRGIGRALFEGLLRALTERGHRSAGLWVLIDNTPARRFYERAGGRTGATREFERTGATLHEIAYVWDELGPFCRKPGYKLRPLP